MNILMRRCPDVSIVAQKIDNLDGALSWNWLSTELPLTGVHSARRGIRTRRCYGNQLQQTQLVTLRLKRSILSSTWPNARWVPNYSLQIYF